MIDEGDVERRILEECAFERRVTERGIIEWLRAGGHPDIAAKLEAGEHRGPVVHRGPTPPTVKRPRYSAELGCLLDDIPLEKKP